jgi:hypothetical protein
MSTDGGKTFSLIYSKTGIFDHPELTAGNGAVWVTFADNVSGGIQIAASGAPVTGLGKVGTFTMFLVPGSDNENFGDVAISPKGLVMVTFQSSLVSTGPGPDDVMISTNPDPFGTGTFSTPSIAVHINVGDARTIPASPDRSMAANLGLAYDRSSGAHKGRVYLVYTDAADTTTNDTNIFVIHSDDNGNSWSTPLRVNDDKTTNSQFFGKVAVDQTTGNVAFAWYDARNDPGSGPGDTDGKVNTDVEVFGTVSLDGGKTVLPNVQIALGPTNGAAAGTTDFGNDLGDYIGLAYDKNKFFAAWTDNSAQLQGNPDGPPTPDIAVGSVTTPGGPGGTGGGGLPQDRFDPNNTSDKAHQFGILTGAQQFGNLTIANTATGLPTTDWFQWTAGTSGIFHAKITYTTLNGGDLHLRAFTLDGNLNLIQIASSRLIGTTTQEIAVPVAFGEQVLVWVYGFNHEQGTYTLFDSIT